MSDNSPTSSTRKPLLADTPSVSDTTAAQSRVLVTGGRAVRPNTVQGTPSTADAAPNRWTPVIVLGVIQMALLGGALAWGGQYLSQKLTNSRIGTSTEEPASTTSPGMKVALDKANAQISALQRQLDAQSEERAQTQGRLQEMADRMALVIQQSSYTPGGETPRVSASDASQVAAMLPSVTPSMAELLLIKERNRLTAYADKAIATGSRADLQALVEAMMDPAMKNLLHASQAEFKRVQAYYDMGISIDPGYTLPLREIFKDTPVSREADLTPAQLHTLLQDTKQPWEARLRAAYLLRSSNDPETNTLLLKALKDDPMLDVAKQAQITFENRVGRKFRLFDIPAIESWWQAQGGDKPVLKMKEPGK